MKLYSSPGRVAVGLVLTFTVAVAACGDSSTPGSSPTPVVVVTATSAPAEPSPAAPPTLVAAATASPPSSVPTTFSDPFAYCAAVGTIDAPDERYTGAPYPDAIINGLESAVGAPPGQFRGPAAPAVFPWRCMDGDVWACYPGANLPCYKADTSREPTQASRDFCQEHPDEPGIPAADTGHGTIFEWACQGGVPVIIKQVDDVDPRGFITRYWYVISP